MVLKHFLLPEKHFKANFFSHYDPSLTHPITHPRDCRDGVTKRGDVGLIKVKKQVVFKIRGFKAFLDHVLFYFFFH